MNDDSIQLLEQLHAVNDVVVQVQQRVEHAVTSVSKIVEAVHQIGLYQAQLARMVESRIVAGELEAILAATTAAERGCSG